MFELKVTAQSFPELLEKIAALAALGPGASPGDVEVPLPEPTPRKPRAKAADKPQEPEKTDGATDPKADPQNPASKAETRPTETASAQSADAGPDTSASAEDASEGSAEVTSGPTPSEEPPPASEEREIVAPGHAFPGELYVFAGELPVADGRRMTYRNGERFSGVKDWSGFRAYASHAPAALTEEEQAQEEVDALPVDMPEEVKVYALQVKNTQDFQDVKKALMDLQKTPYWANATSDDQNEVRFNTWDIMVETGLAAKLDPASDLSAYRLWLEWEEEPETIEATLSKLEDSVVFKGDGAQRKPISDSMKENVRAATAARLEALAPE